MEFEDIDLERLTLTQLQGLQDRDLTTEQLDELDETIEEKIEELANGTVSVMTKYHICEFCEATTSTEEQMVRHILENHKDELLEEHKNDED